MTKLRTIIADDESLARQLLRALLLDNPALEIIAECKNGRETVERVQELKPDLIFIDIHMPGTSGFDVVKELASDIIPMVVFCTAHQRFALDIFDKYAVDYLLKPLDEQLVQRTVQRCCARFRYGNDMQRETSALLTAIFEIDELIKRLDTGRDDKNSNLDFEQNLGNEHVSHILSISGNRAD